MSGTNKNEILTPHVEHTKPIETAVEPPNFALEQENNREQKLNLPKEEGFLDDAISKLRSALRTTKKKPVIMPQVRDDITLKIEHIMSEGLTDAYRSLTPLQQQEFKLRGEQTAVQIRILLQETKIKVKKIFQLLIEWLKLLPGVNRYFLEQEAKIKADHIIALHQQNKHF